MLHCNLVTSFVTVISCIRQENKPQSERDNSQDGVPIEESYLLGYNEVPSVEHQLTFWRKTEATCSSKRQFTTQSCIPEETLHNRSCENFSNPTVFSSTRMEHHVASRSLLKATQKGKGKAVEAHRVVRRQGSYM
jgi:hypothetical protein